MMNTARNGMVSGFDPAWLDTLSKHIATLERSSLEGSEPDEMDLTDIFEDYEQTFFSIQGLSDFWSVRPGVDFGQHIIDLVVGAHNQRQADLTVVLTGTPRKLSMFVSLGTALTTRTMLEGILPSVQLRPVSAMEVARLVAPNFHYQGVLTGIPSRKGIGAEPPAQQQNERKHEAGLNTPQGHKAEAQGASQLERVIRGMDGAQWVYIVQAHPRPRKTVAEVRLQMIDLLAHISSQSRIQLQTTQQDSQQVTSIMSGSRTQTSSSEVVNYRAQYLIRLLERELERLDQATASGQWLVSSYFGASDPDDARRLASLLMGTLVGKDSRPDPLRALLCRSGGLPLSTFGTFLTSDEVATLIQPPREEVPGYAIHDFVRFDVDFRPLDSESLVLGHIQQNGRDAYDTYNISLDALTKHAVVVGVTGSGKTTTVMNLLDRMVEAKKPFLVIEPAKTEYRALHSIFEGRANLHVYTLGNEMIAPFRLNPFEFETDDEQGSSSALAHIDFLKAVFNASFVLYAPMPHVLETALHEVYEDKGWDVASGRNLRVPNWSERHLYPVFPTLTDLYHKIEIVTNRLGYHDEVERNVKAGLKARVGSLRLGSKGLMLDTARGIPMSQLLSAPAILEMEGIGSDEEKTFVMGLFLAKLYEYRRLQAATGMLPSGLQHLMVFEEAHRLLKNTPTQVDSESSNMRAQAIEMFTNMLSEVRAYGQGVLVAEQIPSKLAPDVLKNTNLKIAHRLIAQDDRQSVGQTMNLNADQVTHLGVLAPGMAAVYAEGADHAYLVRLENYKRNLFPLKDAQLKQISPSYASVHPYQSIMDLDRYAIPLSPFGGPDAVAYQAADKLLETDKSQWLWANILLRALLNPEKLLVMLQRLPEMIEADLPYFPVQRHDELMRLVLIRGSAEILGQRGARLGWTYPQVEMLRMTLTSGLIVLLQTHSLERAQSYLEQFTTMYKTLSRRQQGPFAGCVHCKEKCLYRAEVNTLLSKKDVEWIDGEITSGEEKTPEARYSAAAVTATNIADRWLGDTKDISASVGYCAVMHTATRSDFTEYEQVLIGDSIVPYLLD